MKTLRRWLGNLLLTFAAAGEYCHAEARPETPADAEQTMVLDTIVVTAQKRVQSLEPAMRICSRFPLSPTGC